MKVLFKIQLILVEKCGSVVGFADLFNTYDLFIVTAAMLDDWWYQQIQLLK